MNPSESPVFEKVARHIDEQCERYFGKRAAQVHVHGPKDVDYWSIIQTYTVLTKHGARHTVFCKMPKYEWQLRSPEQLDLDPSAPAMARIEYDSLVKLSAVFENAEPALRVIRPLDLLSHPNAILTEGVDEAIEVYQCLRSADQGKHSREAALDMVHKCGRWLGHFHGHSATSESVEPLGDLQRQLQHLRTEASQGGKYAEPLLPYLAQAEALNIEYDSEQTLISEGFEVRNFIVSKNTIYFLDPGKLLLGSRYDDLARFLASLSVLYWGKLKLLWKTPTEDLYARTFLQGYESVYGSINRPLLKAHMVKQYLKLWLEGLKVLDFKPYPRPLKWIGRRFYLPSFFCKRIEEEFGCLKQAI
jgi:hypothetical protein